MSELFTLFTAKVKQMRHAQGESKVLMAKAIKDGEKFPAAYSALKEERKLEDEVDIMIQDIEQEFSTTQHEAIQS